MGKVEPTTSRSDGDEVNVFGLAWQGGLKVSNAEVADVERGCARAEDLSGFTYGSKCRYRREHIASGPEVNHGDVVAG